MTNNLSHPQRQKYSAGLDIVIADAGFLIQRSAVSPSLALVTRFFGERLEGDPASFWIPLNKRPLVLESLAWRTSPEYS